MRTRGRIIACGIVAFGAGIYLLVSPSTVNPIPAFWLLGIGAVIFLLAFILR